MPPLTSVYPRTPHLLHVLNGVAPAGWRHALWLAILVGASLAFSLGFACAVPFAAFGTVIALTVGRREGLVLTVALWLVNQIAGFAVLGYPWTAVTFEWGAVLGVVAVLTTFAARSTARLLDASGAAIVVSAAFASAFVVYEGTLFAVSAAWLGGTEIYVVETVVRILEINAAACVGLLAVNRVAAIAGLAVKPAVT